MRTNNTPINPSTKNSVMLSTLVTICLFAAWFGPAFADEGDCPQITIHVESDVAKRDYCSDKMLGQSHTGNFRAEIASYRPATEAGDSLIMVQGTLHSAAFEWTYKDVREDVKANFSALKNASFENSRRIKLSFLTTFYTSQFEHQGKHCFAFNQFRRLTHRVGYFCRASDPYSKDEMRDKIKQITFR